jgi:hypothetical protein
MEAVLDEFHSCGGGISGGKYRKSGRTTTSGDSAYLAEISRVYLAGVWPPYLIVERGDLLEKLLILLLGVTILGRGARLVTTARGTVTCEL